MEYAARVTVHGPIPEDDHARHFIKESIRTVLSDRGFKRASQQVITLVTDPASVAFKMEVSVPHAYADQASTEMATALYDELVASASRAGCAPCELSRPFVRH